MARPGLEAEFNDKILGKAPIILVPGIVERWNIFRFAAVRLRDNGHPVYEVKGLGWNFMPVERGARLIRKMIDCNNLENVVLLTHSKGGLIGKYALAFLNSDQKIKKVIAIATPFAGSALAEKIPLDPNRELIPGSEVLRTLDNYPALNSQITCVYPVWDNHIQPLESCALEGAQNIQVDVLGHHKIIYGKATEDIILKLADDV